MRITCIVLVAGMTLPLFAADGTLLAQSSDSPPFSVYTVNGALYAAATQSELLALPPVFIRSGETVTATSPDDGVTTLTSPSLTSVLNAGGIWTLASSAQGTARIGVAWTVHNDGGTLASGVTAESYGIDSAQPGPDRKANLADILPVAYSGDNWIGDVSAAAALTFVSPDGAETTLNLAGTGATTQFKFGKPGSWTVRLTMASGATRTAVISVCGGLVIVFT